MPELVVALDVADLEEALALFRKVRPAVRWAKVGLSLFTSAGPRAVAALRELGAEVFLDLKLHDIPHQVALAAAQAGRLGAAMLTVHAAAGKAALIAAKEAAPHLKVVAVTVLTSLSAADTEMLFGEGFAGPDGPYELARRLLGAAREACVDGAVASVDEVARLRRLLPPPFLFVTPGIRRGGDAPSDQARVATAAEARRAGSDFVVVGRPITESRDPLQAAREFQTELAGEGEVAS